MIVFFFANVPFNQLKNKFVTEHKQIDFHSQTLKLKPYFYLPFSLFKLENWYLNKLILFSYFVPLFASL